MKFRKVISLVLSVVMATSMTSFTANAVEVDEATITEDTIVSVTESATPDTIIEPTTIKNVKSVLIGDTDLNAYINVKDATQIQKYILGLTTFSGDALTAAECDGDSIVTVKDATVIQKYLAGFGKTINVGQYYDVDRLYSANNWQDVLATENRKGNFYFNGKETDSLYGRKVIDKKYYGALLDVSQGDIFRITTRTTSNTLMIVFYSDYSYVDGTALGESNTVLSGYGAHSKNYDDTFVAVPEGAKYMGVCSYITGSYATNLEVLKWTTPDNVFNVTDYGASGNDEKDDTLAFQQCLEEAKGCPIIVPSGTYIVNNTKEGSVNYTGNVFMIGCGMPKIKRTDTDDVFSESLGKLTQKYQPMITIRDAGYVHISGINFDGQRDDHVASTATGKEWIGTAAVYILGSSSNITVENCYFEQCSREAILCGEINEKLKDESGDYRNGKIENVLVRNNVFDNVSANFWSHGVDIRNVILENNYSNHCRTKGFEFDTENDYRAENIIIRKNEFVDLFQDCILMSNCHNVLIEENVYSPFEGTAEDYSPYMGIDITPEPYFVCVLPRPDEVNAEINNSTDFVVRNNKAVCNRFISFKTLDTNKNISYDDVLFKNFEVYNNTVDCKEFFIGICYSKNIVSHNNKLRGIHNEKIWADSIYRVGAGANEYTVYQDTIVDLGNNVKLLSKIPGATLNVTDKTLSVPYFTFSNCACLSLSEKGEMTNIDMTGLKDEKFVLYVKKHSLTVTSSDTILIPGKESVMIAPYKKVEFVFNGSKWVVQNCE